MINETSTDDIDFLRQLILSQDTPQLPSSASTPDINSPLFTPVIIPSNTPFNIEVNFFSKIRRLFKEEIILQLTNQLNNKTKTIEITNDENEKKTSAPLIVMTELQELRKKQHEEYLQSNFYKEVLENKEMEVKKEDLEQPEDQLEQPEDQLEQPEDQLEQPENQLEPLEDQPEPPEDKPEPSEHHSFDVAKNTLLSSSNTSLTLDSYPYPNNTTVIMGDSMLSGIDEEKLKVNYKNIKVRYFPGASINDMKHYSIPILNKKPKNIILHIGTNDCKNSTSGEVYAKVQQLIAMFKSQLPTVNVIISTIIGRTDSKEAQMIVSQVNMLLKSSSLTIMDNGY